jgi:ribosomal protein S18 acetylase RimI-like enzyme
MVQIRIALPEDAPAIAAVLAFAFKDYEAFYTPEAFAATTPSSEFVQNRMDEGPVWVALTEDVIAGTVSALAKGEDVYIRSLAVLPGARGQRIGEALLGISQADV